MLMSGSLIRSVSSTGGAVGESWDPSSRACVCVCSWCKFNHITIYNNVSSFSKSKAFPSSHALNHHTFPIISSFKASSLSCSLLSRYSTLEKCFGLMAMLLNCFWSMELKMTSRERGRMPGSVEVPVTVYVLPSVGNGSVQQLKWCV